MPRGPAGPSATQAGNTVAPWLTLYMIDSATPGNILAALHELRCREFDLSEALGKLPRQQVIHQGKLNKATKNREENTARLKQLQLDHRARETSIKQLAQHIDKLETQRASLSTPKEFEAIDHEVDHDYAGLQSEHPTEQAAFAARRAAAYHAYWEHMPMPRTMRPSGGAMSLFGTTQIGDLFAFHMLDTRQYRSTQVCSKPPRVGGSRVFVDECPTWEDPGRSMLGGPQERWIDGQLRGSKARWNLLGQGVVFSLVDEDPSPRTQHWNDSWAGYSPARQRLLGSVATSGVANPLILGGDIHAFIAGDQRLQAGDSASPIVMSELVTTSISSGPPPKRVIQAYQRDGNDVLFADGDRRGYLWMEIGPQRLEARLQGYDSVREETGAEERTLFTCALEDGRRGLQR